MIRTRIKRRTWFYRALCLSLSMILISSVPSVASVLQPTDSDSQNQQDGPKYCSMGRDPRDGVTLPKDPMEPVTFYRGWAEGMVSWLGCRSTDPAGAVNPSCPYMSNPKCLVTDLPGNAPTPSASPSASGSPTATPSSSPTASSSPSSGSTASSSPTSGGSTQPGGPKPKMATSVAADRLEVNFNQPFVVQGRVTSENATCKPTSVILSKRVHGSDAFAELGKTEVGDDGSWALDVTSEVNAAYMAKVQDTSACTGESSAPVDVLVRAKLAVQVPQRCSKRGTVVGRVFPNQSGTRILLEARAGSNWTPLDRKTVGEQSAFKLQFHKCGSRSFRVRWDTQGSTNTSTRKTFRL